MQYNTIKTAILVNLIFLFIINFNCFASQHLPLHKPVPGGIAVIPLDIKSLDPPIVFFNNNQTLVIRYNNLHDKSTSWITVIGIPITTKPGLHKISVHADPIKHNKFRTNLEKSFVVYQKKYPKELLKIDPNLVSPPTEEIRMRAAKEIKNMQAAYNHWSQQIPNLKLQNWADN